MLSDLMEVEQGGAAQEKEPISSGEEPRVVKVITEKFVNPLRIISGKFTNFERLIEHVMDLESLPEMRINPKHSEELSELDEERRQLEADADKIHSEARRTWGSFTDVKLEQNPQHGFILRTAKSDDERRLRSNNSDVQVLSILKNGVHFTTSALQKMGRRILEVQSEYKVTQNGLVTKAVETAVTYLPVVESVSALIAELDVLLAFSTAAAISPGEYVRPEMLPMGEGIFELKVRFCHVQSRVLIN
jgi:DNA mismatch repair protein MSH2